jgi:hypothetical protein
MKRNGVKQRKYLIGGKFMKYSMQDFNTNIPVDTHMKPKMVSQLPLLPPTCMLLKSSKQAMPQAKTSVSITTVSQPLVASPPPSQPLVALPPPSMPVVAPLIPSQPPVNLPLPSKLSVTVQPMSIAPLIPVANLNFTGNWSCTENYGFLAANVITTGIPVYAEYKIAHVPDQRDMFQVTPVGTSAGDQVRIGLRVPMIKGVVQVGEYLSMNGPYTTGETKSVQIVEAFPTAVSATGRVDVMTVRGHANQDAAAFSVFTGTWVRISVPIISDPTQ